MEKDREYKDEGKSKPAHDGPGLEDVADSRDRETSVAGRPRSDVFSELGFSTFILSLSTSALVHLAELPDPITNEKKINLQLAKQTIAIIEMLKGKTEGNLTEEEGQLIEDLLFDLRLKYIEAAK